MKKLLTLSCLAVAAIHGMHVAMADGEWADHAAFLANPVAPLMVYDANGKAAGVYDDGVATLAIDGIPIVVGLSKMIQRDGSVDSAALKWTIGRPFDAPEYYPTEDCSGPSLVMVGPPGARPIGFHRDSSGNVFIHIGVAGPAVTQVARAATSQGECANGPPATRDFPAEMQAWPTERVVNLTQLYPEPLTVR